MIREGIIARYRQFFANEKDLEIVSLLEGSTPLIDIGTALDLNFKVYAKYEGTNPTGSFKDRGMTLAISRAKTDKARAVICASTGNTAASAAAYAARAKLPCYILIPKDYVALGKLSQALIHGARVIAIEGHFDKALEIVRELVQENEITLVNSLNPRRIEGQKTAAFEIYDQLGYVPSHIAIPVGNAGNITAYWKGFKEYKENGLTDSLPIMLGCQAAGSAPLVLGKPIANPETIATAIRIGNPASWSKALEAKEESQGEILALSDQEILKAYKLLAQKAGIFCEPASAASLAGLLKLNDWGYFSNKAKLTVVCVLTGHGLKDTDSALVQTPKIIESPAHKSAIEEIIWEDRLWKN